MKISLKLIIVYCVFIVVVCLGCIVYGLVSPNPTEVLPCDVISYKMVRGQTAFLNLLPGVVISGLMIGFSQYFGLHPAGDQKRFSRKMLTNLKHVLFVCGIVCVLCFCLEELAHPYFIRKSNDFNSRREIFLMYLENAQINLEENDFGVADFYVSSAKKIYSDSEEVQKLERLVELEAAAYRAEQEQQFAQQQAEELAKKEEEEMLSQNLSLVTASAADPLQLIFASQTSFNNKDYLSAHYYARCALEMSAEGSANNIAAQKLASLAWNKVNAENMSESVDAEQTAFFRQKKKGYDALIQNDIIQAYYIFYSLNTRYPTDSEVSQYFEIAKTRLKEMVFFINETDEIRNFEVSSKVGFSLNNSNGTKSEITIAGISIVEDSGQMVQYLRDFIMRTYDGEGRMIESVYVPYAKMFAHPVTDEKGKVVDYKPFLMLHSVDKSNSEKQILPIIWRAADYSAVSTDKLDGIGSVISLDMPYSDFNLIRQASSGPDVMPLFTLFSFAQKADEYGFSGEVYSALLVYRLCYPLVMLALLIIAALLSWYYRILPNSVFKFSWIGMYPLLTLLSWGITRMAQYFTKLIFLVMYSVMGGEWLLVVALGFAVLIVFINSLIFLSARGE